MTDYRQQARSIVADKFEAAHRVDLANRIREGKELTPFMVTVAIASTEAALRLSAGADWVLVPREPTDEMVDAAWESEATSYVGEHKCIISASDAYRAMIAAAPRHEPGEG